MGKIHSLQQDLINQIAAGEVIESSHSILKECIENSVDAGASQISIETKAAGLDKIVILDNGSGILEEDLELAVMRHATSKIEFLPDLDSLCTYGFRGEALASIASVSKMSLESGVESARFAYKIKLENGKITSREPTAHFVGTKIEIHDLFYNTPVRRKFLKSENSEDRRNKSRIQISALTRPNVAFHYVQDGKTIYRLASEDRQERIISIFGENLRDHLLPIEYERNGLKITGFISDPDFYRSNRMGQYFFVNDRPIDLKHGSYLLKKCYDELLPPGAHPWCFLYFEIPPDRIDVNVHPQKKEIRFLDDEFINGFLISALQKELRSSTPVSFLELKKRMSAPIRGTGNFASFQPNNQNYVQGSNQTSQFQDILHRDIFPNAERREAYELSNTGAGTNLSELSETPSKHSQFIPKRHYGILFETFILAEAEDGLYIIDQHTAHERIRYEEVLKKLKSKGYGTQPLLTPIRLDLSNDEAEDILSQQADLHELGIGIEDFGNGSLVIREVPGYMDSGKEKETILDFMNRTLHSDTAEPEPYDLMAKSVACRSAIRKGSQVSDAIISEILNRLSYCENPARCPHGRPTLVKLTRDDLEKMFHRK
ncbi:MAG: DNA mismatch repair protein MutL [Leptospira sp.]|nr:MAG: DNA mismatch repair protein MutL [Leptospira sp.]